jgi:transcriptional regulator NrdR family protein
VINNINESGRLLNSALARHFRSLHCNGTNIAGDAPATVLTENLYNYIKDVFLQLDSHHSGYVSREDFEALCEILQIDKSPPVSKRNSGLQWLSSYHPRPNTPASPIRVDRLSEAKFKPTGPKPPEKDPTSFLYTVGPRPFWELWPHKKYKKKNLKLEDFVQCLLDHWAKTHGYPLIKYAYINKDVKPAPQANINKPSELHVDDDTRVQRLKRSMVRLTKRYHKLERMSKISPVSSDQVSASPRQNVNLNATRNGNSTIHTNGFTNGNANGIKNGYPKTNGHIKETRESLQGFKIKKSSFFNSSKRIEKLEKQVLQQQTEIQSLTDVVEHLRSSLQLSDAQNLALQVLLKKMAKAELKLPVAETSDFRNQIKQSEQQLENLVSELKEMSKTKYPTIPSNIYSGSTCSFNDTTHLDLGIEEELERSHESISGVQKDLTSTQKQLKDISKQLEPKESIREDLNMKEAYKALLKTEKEIEKLRSNLSEAQSSLEITHSELVCTKKELKETKQSLTEKTKQLSQSEQRISQLYENRKSLLCELKSTKDVLISSLRNVQDLEIESKKVPQLELRIDELERSFLSKNSGKMSKISSEQIDDSFLFTSSESEQDDSSSKLLDQSIPEDEILFSGLPGTSSDLGLPPRPPSVRSKDKSVRSTTPNSEKDVFSPTPSSGHYSAGSTSFLSKSPGDKNDSVIPRLRSEIDHLKKRFSQSERDWAEERNSLLSELNRRREDFGDSSSVVHDLREERLRLSQIEEKIKEILQVLKSLNSMKVSNDVLGKLVLEAVEKAYDEVKGEVQVFRFLNILYHSTREYERKSADSLLTDALDAVKDSNSDSSDSLGNVPVGMGTIQPRRPSSSIKEPKLESLFRIDV